MTEEERKKELITILHDYWFSFFINANDIADKIEQLFAEPIEYEDLETIVEQELLDKIYNETLKKPNSFYYLCYAGGTVKIVDQRTNEKTFTCKHQGDKNWLTPACEKCTGLSSENESLTEHERILNNGMKILYDAISRVLANKHYMQKGD